MTNFIKKVYLKVKDYFKKFNKYCSSDIAYADFEKLESKKYHHSEGNKGFKAKHTYYCNYVCFHKH